MKKSRARANLAEDRAVGMMYSPDRMDSEREIDIGRLEEQLAELEKLVEELENVPESRVVDVLNRAVALLTEVNAGIEAGLVKAEGEVQMLGDLLQKVNFGPFDAALEDLERSSGSPGGS